ncbi:DUF3626 domain-containing protein [Streptomyces griseoincarnatus]
MSGVILRESQERALAHVARLASGPPMDPDLRVTLNFHPDRVSQGRPILRALADNGVYVSQFVTGTSNGGLTARPGGDRWRRHPGYRGPEIVELGTEIAVAGVLDPRMVGKAAATGRHDPQTIKKVWHCLARFGAPATSSASPR